MANTENKININIRLADVKAFALSIPAEDEELFRESEKMVNKLWNKWMTRYKGTDTSEEVMAKVAFQLARLYALSFRDNKSTSEYMKDFEQKLDEILLKVQ